MLVIIMYGQTTFFHFICGGRKKGLEQFTGASHLDTYVWRFNKLSLCNKKMCTSITQLCKWTPPLSGRYLHNGVLYICVVFIRACHSPPGRNESYVHGSRIINFDIYYEACVTINQNIDHVSFIITPPLVQSRQEAPVNRSRPFFCYHK